MHQQFPTQLIDRFFNLTQDHPHLDRKARIKISVTLFVMFMAGISSPVVGALHWFEVLGYDSVYHAADCLVFSLSQFLLMAYLLSNPDKQAGVAQLATALIFLIFASNLVFSVNEEIRLLWFVILFFVADMMGGQKLRAQAEVATYCLIVVYFSVPGLAQNMDPINAISSILILVLLDVIIRYYSAKTQDFQDALQHEVSERTYELNMAKDQAELASTAKTAFLSRMSHELRTPLNAIIGFSQILDMTDGLNNEAKTCSREINKAGEHLLNLIKEILDLSRIEAGKVKLTFSPVETKSLAKECLSLVEPIARKADVNLDLSISDDLYVLADPMRLKQALLNLLSNAIKYNKPQGEVSLSITAIKDDAIILLSVIDTGVGLTEDQQSELFQPFNRLGADNSPVEGTGIGLTITRQLVELMGGTIGAQSVKDKGSTFWIELPAVEAEERVEELAPRTTEPGPQKLLPTEEATVLYIEDNPANINLVTHLLSKHEQIQFVAAHKPELGIDYAQKHKPQLILLDINMPDMNGYQVLKILRAKKHLQQVPIIAITANAHPDDIEHGLTAGFDEYLTKPINVPHFNQTIDKYLGIH